MGFSEIHTNFTIIPEITNQTFPDFRETKNEKAIMMKIVFFSDLTPPLLIDYLKKSDRGFENHKSTIFNVCKTKWLKMNFCVTCLKKKLT